MAPRRRAQAAADPEQARLRVMAARIVAERRWPYLATVLYSLRLVPVPHAQLSTMAVDSGWRMYYSPEFVMGEDVEVLATVVLHEAMHAVMAHAERFQAIAGASHAAWNIAGDCAINHALDQARMPWTRTVTPLRFTQFKKLGLKHEQSTEWNHRRVLDSMPAGALAAAATGDCGSVGDGRRRAYELPSPDADCPAASSEQRATTRDRVASDILAAERAHGSVPAGLLRWAQEHLEPMVDWRRVLGVSLRQAVATVAGRRDYSYMRPSRRQDALASQGSTVILPAMRQPAPPRVAIVVDTSGSIGDEELRQYVGEVAGIVRAVGVSQGVWVIACDAHAGPAQRLRSPGSVESLELEGGGGTDMSAGIEAALAIRPTPTWSWSSPTAGPTGRRTSHRSQST